MKLYEPFQFLTAEECDEIIAYADSQTKKQGSVQNNTRNVSVRNNRIVWYEKSDKWQRWIQLFNKIENKIDWIQTPQIGFYKPGEEYKWHVDTWPNYRTHIRHFTLTCELQTAPGSGVELEEYNIPKLKKGQAVIFKPGDRHRATSPTEGERISFTIWAMAINPDKR
jgi:predicted 2-oxoglutarate/Fe(II)-dependent dioxygenase YbiX